MNKRKLQHCLINGIVHFKLVTQNRLLHSMQQMPFFANRFNQVRHNHAEIEDYFVHFLAKGPQGVINESNVRIFGDIAINSGYILYL